MIKSMTGYGKAECEYQAKRIYIEIKTLNSKQLDLNIKVPSFYKEKELDIRNEISRELERGKVDFFVNVENSAEDTQVSFNRGILKGYYAQVVELSNELGIAVPEDIMNTLLRLPDVLKSEKQELSDEEWNAFLQGIKRATAMLQEFRIQEGDALAKDILGRIEFIMNYAQMLTPFEKQRIEKMRLRLNQSLGENLAKEQIDSNRFEQELIYYLEKLDITEEKVRLANHCSYFTETIHDSESSGKKLGFIAQEIGREINTIGSKANDADMQKIVVKMKDELEKIKEQINNIL